MFGILINLLLERKWISERLRWESYGRDDLKGLKIYRDITADMKLKNNVNLKEKDFQGCLVFFKFQF